MYIKYIKRNILVSSIGLFIFIFSIIHMIKPSMVYDIDGVPREFGIGWRNKTILPIWLLVIIIAITSYLFVLYYLL